MSDSAQTTAIPARRWLFWATLLALGLGLGWLVWHTRLTNPRLVRQYPPDGADDVSIQTTVWATLSRAPRRDDVWRLSVEPLVQGVARLEGQELSLIPGEPLAHDTVYTVHVEGLDMSWQFTTGPRRVLYLAPDALGAWQLHALTIGEETPVQLTTQPIAVHDYAISPTDDAIAFTGERDDGGHDIWLMGRDGSADHMILACPEASCVEVTWRPGDRALLYERHDADGAALWVVDLLGETAPLLWEGRPLAATLPRVSADGRWLAAVCAETEQMLIYELGVGEGDLIAGQSGLPAAWHRERNALLMSHVQWQDHAFGVGLLLADLDNGEIELLTGGCEEDDPTIEDVLPAWSPDGSSIAFGRAVNALGGGAARQIWLMDAEGTDARVLLADPLIHHGAPHWSPDGTLLLYSRHHLAQPGVPAPLGVLDPASGVELLLPVSGTWPAWLP